MIAIGSKILVEKDAGVRQVEKIGNLEIPGDRNDSDRYKVVSVGKEVTDELKPGDIVYTYHNPGHEFREDGKSYRIISIADILVVL